MFDDPHMNAGGLVDVTLSDGRATKLPALPVEMAGRRFADRAELAHPGKHSREILAGLGLADSEVDRLIEQGVVEAA